LCEVARIASTLAALASVGCTVPPAEIAPLGLPSGDCHAVAGIARLHPGIAPGAFDHGPLLVQALPAGTRAAWEFPLPGAPADTSVSPHRLPFPQRFALCLPPGRHTLLAAWDRDHDGWACEIGQPAGFVDIVVPTAAETVELTVDRLVQAGDRCDVVRTAP
jgi:hypothetical protein